MVSGFWVAHKKKGIRIYEMLPSILNSVNTYTVTNLIIKGI